MLINAILLIFTEIALILCGLVMLRGLQFIFPNLLSNGKTLSLSLTAILGLIGSTFLASMLSIWMRINWEVFSGLLIFLGVYTLMDWHWLRSYFQKFSRFTIRQDGADLLLFGLFLILVLATSADPDRSYDDGLYHLQSVLLITQHKIIPGLGLLHNRFAYNAIWHVSSALWGYPFLHPEHLLYFTATPLLMLNFVAFLLRSLKKEKLWPMQALMLVLLLVSTTYMVYYRFDYGAADNNLPSFILVWLAMLLFIQQGFFQKISTNGVLDTLLFLLLVVFSWTVKISTLMLIIPAGYLTGQLWKKQPIAAVQIFGISLLLLFPWSLRSLFTSGFFVYPPPAAWFGLPFKWQMPYAMARENALVDISWAKLPGVSAQAVSEMRLVEWMPLWFQSLDRNELLLIAASLLAITTFAFTILIKFKQLREKKHLTAAIIFLCWMLASLVFWFFSYPDPRFFYGSAMPIIASLLLTISFWLKEKMQFTSPNLRRSGLLVTTLFLALLFVRLNILSEIDYTPIKLHPAPIPQVAVRQISLNGFILNLPVSGDQCWGSAVPCIPDKCSEAVHLLGDTLLGGFTFIE
jgi:hypothetical protein